MNEKMIVSGFGGQGILFFGKLLCQAGMSEGLNVTYLPSYGAEVRGGTAHCHVILSSDTIPSPVIKKPEVLIIMNEPSLLKFEGRVMPKGLIVINSSLVEMMPERKDVEIYSIPATEMAVDLGNIKTANMVALGVCIANRSIVSIDSARNSLPVLLKSDKKNLIDVNTKALNAGYSYSG